MYKVQHTLYLYAENTDMKEKLLTELQKTKEQLLSVLSSFNQNQLNTIPFEGSWTAGQVMQHIILSASSVKVLRGPVKTSSRKADEHVAKLQSIFLDFSTKMNSPDFIIPDHKDYDVNELQTSFEDIAAQIKDIIETTDLSEICLSTPKVLGELTRLEVIRFIHFHTQRHTHQLHNIKTAIESKADN